MLGEQRRGFTERAFADLFGSYRDRLIRQIRGIVQDQDLAEDAVQEAFCRAWERRQSLSSCEDLYAWLYVVARNYAWKVKLQDSRILSLDSNRPTESFTDVREPPLPEYDVLEVWGVIRQLPAEYQQLLVLKYVQNRTLEDIAHQFKTSVSAIKAKLHRARKVFRRQWLQRAMEE